MKRMVEDGRDKELRAALPRRLRVLIVDGRC